MIFVKKNLSAIIAFVLILLISIPIFTFAQDVLFNESNAGIGGVMARILTLLRFFITILMVAATAFFIYGVVMYIFTSDKEEGKKRIINGLIGLFIIVAFWGIIRIVQNTFGVGNSSSNINQNDIGCIQGINC